MVKAVSKTEAGQNLQPATHYPGNNLSKQSAYYSELTNGRFHFLPLFFFLVGQGGGSAA